MLHWMLTAMLMLVPATKPADAPADNADDADALLTMLDQRGDDLRTLTADVTLTRVDPLTGLETGRAGQLWFDDTGETPLFRVNFGDKTEGDKRYPDTATDYILRGNVLEERDYGEKRIVYRKLAKEGEKVDLFALGTDPLPLPIGQDPTEVKKRFDITDVQGEGPDLPSLALEPKPDTDLAKRMLVVEMWIDTELKLPTQVIAVDPDGSEQVMVLSNVVLNKPIAGEKFKVEKPDANEWEIHEE